MILMKLFTLYWKSNELFNHFANEQVNDLPDSSQQQVLKVLLTIER